MTEPKDEPKTLRVVFRGDHGAVARKFAEVLARAEQPNFSRKVQAIARAIAAKGETK